MEKKITYDDTRDIAIRCIDKLIALNILSEEEHNSLNGNCFLFEIQDIIQDEINEVLELDIDEKFETTIKTK